MTSLLKKIRSIAKVDGPGDKNFVSLYPDSNITALIDKLNQTIFQLGPNGKWIYLNDEWEKLCGFTIEETLGTNYAQYIHPDDREQCVHFIDDMLKNNAQPASVRIRYLTKSGGLCWVNMRANNFLNKKDNKIHIAGVLSNITERVREYDLHQANFRTLSELINNLRGLVYRGRNNREWTMEFVSDGCLDLTGYKPKDMINKTVTFGSLINPNDQELVWTNVQSALAEDRPYNISYRIKTRNGEEKWVWDLGQGNFSSGGGELLSIEGFIVDITDYKRNKLEEDESHLYRMKTKIPQKNLFTDRLDLAVIKTDTVKNYKFAFMVIYTDRFNKLQERYAADVIDQIITNVSNRLYSIINKSDSLCTFDVGEFALLIEHIDSINDVKKIIQSIRKKFMEPVVVDDTQIFLTLSIGVTLAPEPVKDGKTVIKEAYSALGHAKALGGSRYEIFNDTINAKVYALDRMEDEIHYALHNEELMICYQPIVSTVDSTVTSLETQLYWRHQRRGKIPASAFLPTETNNNVVALLNNWIIANIFKQIDAWATQGSCKQKLDIIIQFCGKTILHDDLLKQLEQISYVTSHNKFGLLIKLPEKIINPEAPQTVSRIRQLKNQGVNPLLEMDAGRINAYKNVLSLAADSVMVNTPANIEDPVDLLYTKAQIDFIHAFGKKVIADGIDSEEKQKTIRKLPCDYVKGKAVIPALDQQQLMEFISSNGSCAI